MKRTAHSIHRTGMARMRDVHLIAANEPLTPADRALAAKFDGPLDGDVQRKSTPITPVSPPTERQTP